MASAIDVRIDDVGLVLKFRVGFPLSFEENSAGFCQSVWLPESILNFRIGSVSSIALTLQSLLFSIISLLFLFSDFPCFFVRFSSLFPRILGVPRREKPLLFWGPTLAFSKKARIGGSGWGVDCRDPVFADAVSDSQIFGTPQPQKLTEMKF